MSALMSFGKQLPPKPMPGNRNDDPMRRSGADRLAHLIDVGAERFADVRNLVHERDARGENRVRRVLAHLGAGADPSP